MADRPYYRNEKDEIVAQSDNGRWRRYDPATDKFVGGGFAKAPPDGAQPLGESSGEETPRRRTTVREQVMNGGRGVLEAARRIFVPWLQRHDRQILEIKGDVDFIMGDPISPSGFADELVREMDPQWNSTSPETPAKT